MTSGIPTLPDVDDVLVAYLTAQLDPVGVSTELPADLAAALPRLQVRRVTGAIATRIHDRAFVDVNAVAATADDASVLARRAEALLLGTRNVTVALAEGGAVLGNVESVIRPRWLPYPNTAVRLYGATYSIKLHPAPAGP